MIRTRGEVMDVDKILRAMLEAHKFGHEKYVGEHEDLGTLESVPLDTSAMQKLFAKAWNEVHQVTGISFKWRMVYYGEGGAYVGFDSLHELIISEDVKKVTFGG